MKEHLSLLTINPESISQNAYEVVILYKQLSLGC